MDGVTTLLRAAILSKILHNSKNSKFKIRSRRSCSRFSKILQKLKNSASVLLRNRPLNPRGRSHIYSFQSLNDLANFELRPQNSKRATKSRLKTASNTKVWLKALP